MGDFSPPKRPALSGGGSDAKHTFSGSSGSSAEAVAVAAAAADSFRLQSSFGAGSPGSVRSKGTNRVSVGVV